MRTEPFVKSAIPQDIEGPKCTVKSMGQTERRRGEDPDGTPNPFTRSRRGSELPKSSGSRRPSRKVPDGHPSS